MAGVNLSTLQAGIKELSLVEDTNSLSDEAIRYIDLIASNLFLLQNARLSYRLVPVPIRAKVFERAVAQTDIQVLATYVEDQIVPYILHSADPQVQKFAVSNCYVFKHDTKELQIVHGSQLSQDDLVDLLAQIPIEVKSEAKTLSLQNLPLISEVPNLTDFANLKSLDVSLCRNFTNITNVPVTLESLRVDHCPKLTTFPALNCRELNTLFLTDCFALKDFDGIRELPALREADLSGSYYFQDPDCFTQHNTLEKVTLNKLPRLTSLDHFSSFNRIKYICCQNSGVESPGALQLRQNLVLIIEP